MRLIDRFVVRPPRLCRVIYPGALWKIPQPSGQKTVYLTFDDGPEPATTPFILDRLDEAGFKGTFFVVGDNARRHPELIEMIRRRGHALGNHTMHHTRGLKTSREDFVADIEDETRLLDTRLFRPPHGFMRLSQYLYLRKRYRIVMFDVVTRDYDSSLTAEEVHDNVRRYARNGSIIVFHDSLKARQRLVEALPLTLQWLKNEGYESRSIAMEA